MLRAPFTNWRDAMERGVAPALLAEFAENLVYTQCQELPNRQAQPTGKPILIVGIFRLRSDLALQMHGKGQTSVGVETKTPIVELDNGILRTLGIRPQHGDRILRVATGLLYQIRKVQDDGVIHTVVDVSQMGIPTR